MRIMIRAGKMEINEGARVTKGEERGGRGRATALPSNRKRAVEFAGSDR